MSERVKNMTVGKPISLIISFALPLMVGNIFQQMYTVVDTIVVGQVVGVHALAALGAADWLNWMMLGIITGFTQGFSILIAQMFGAEDYIYLRKGVAASVILAGIVAAILLVTSQWSAVTVLRFLNTPDSIIEGSLAYLRIAFAGIPIIMSYNILASILRAMGDSKTPLYAMILAACVNIGLDILFVVGFRWGIKGAAVATVIAQVCSSGYCFAVLRKISILKFQKEEFRFEGHTYRKLLCLGAPMAAQNAIIAIGGMAVQFVINGFGFLFIAGFTAANKLYGVLEVAATSYGYAMTTYIGQNLGAGKIPRIKSGMRSAVTIAAATSIVISVVMIIFGRNIVGMFISGDPVEVETATNIAYRYLKIMSSLLIVLYLLHVYRSALQGMGDTIIPMLSGIIEFAMRIAIAMLLPAIIGQDGIFYAEIAAWTGAVVILLPFYYIRINRLEKVYDS